MYSLQENLGKINIQNAKVSVDRTGNKLLVVKMAEVREKLKTYGVIYDVYTTKALSNTEKNRASNYELLVKYVEDCLLNNKSISKDVINQLRNESIWYNKTILGLEDD